MPTYDHELPARKIQITVTHEVIGEVDGWQERLASVIKVIEKLRFPADIEGWGDRQPDFIIEGIARDLAHHWQAPSRQTDPQVIKQVAKLQGIARALMGYGDDHDDPSALTPEAQMAITKLTAQGISGEMVIAIAKAASTDIYAEHSKPKSGRKNNKSALNLARCFAGHYPVLANREVGVHADHDFVQTLGELFRVMNFEAEPQHYAKLAVKANEQERAKHQAKATAIDQQMRAARDALK